MSRQMACQLTASQLVEWAQKAIDLVAGKEERYATFGEFLDAEVKDPKARVRMGTALVALSTLAEQGMTPSDVLNIIRWRDVGGQPAGELEITFSRSGRRKRLAAVERDRRMSTLRQRLPERRHPTLRQALSFLDPGIFFGGPR